MNPKCNESEVLKVKGELESKGLAIHLSQGETFCIIGVVGETRAIDSNKLLRFSGVDRILKVEEPYKKANRLFKPDDTVIDVRGSLIGGNNLAVMAGPCSVESEEQIIEIAKSVKESGATFLRGGAFKPRTSPYSFQGLELDGLKLMEIAKDWKDYEIIDASCGQKFERWGNIYLLRPDPQVVWNNGDLLEKYHQIGRE